MRNVARMFVGALALVALTVQYAGATPPGTGAMTGGGWAVGPDYRVHLGVALPCDPTRAVNLQVTWEGSKFHLETLTSVSCSFNDPDDPQQGGTHEGSGIGRLNGEAAMIEWKLNDVGDPQPHRTGEGESTSLLAVQREDEDVVELSIAGIGSTEPPTTVAGGIEGGNIRMGTFMNHNETLLADDEL